MVDLDLILSTIRGWIEGKIPISPELWLDSAAKINVLREDVDEAAVLAEMAYNEVKKGFMLQDMPHTKAQVMAKCSDEYKNWQLLLAKQNRLEEWINISKKQATLALKQGG